MHIKHLYINAVFLFCYNMAGALELTLFSAQLLGALTLN